MDARRNFPGGETFGGASKKSEGGPPYFLRQTLKYAYRGGGGSFDARRFFFWGTLNLLRWTSKIYKKGGMSTIYNISTGA